MPRYRIHYLKEAQRAAFRNAAPGAGPLKLKARDYGEGPEVEASSPYAAWKQSREGRKIEVGDALETEGGTLLVCRYGGFEEAEWWRPEAAVSPEGAPGGGEPR